MNITKPTTPVVEAIGRLNITGNVTPHVWYLRSEFRTDSNRPDRNMITAMADILYWYRPREVRDEEHGGIFVGYERKFAREMLQYDYERRGAIFGMSKREMQEACTKLSKRGLVRIEYVTERFKGKLLHNVVYIEPVPEAIASTLSGPNVEAVAKVKGAVRGRHTRKDEPAPDEAPYDPNSGVDDQMPSEDGTPEASPSGTDEQGTSQNSGELENGTSQNFEIGTSQNFERQPPKFWDTYHETSHETSFLRDFKKSSSSVPVDAGADWLPDDDDFPADAETLNPNPTTKAPHQPDQVQPSSQAAEAPLPTDPENVPGAAAGGAAPAWAILALPVIPRAELDSRPERDPASIPQLRALLHCSHKSRLPQLQVELEAATRSGIPRSLLIRLTDQELKAATSAAKTDAPKVEGGFARAGIHALHRLIGEPLTPALLKGEKEPARDVRGAAYDVKNEPSGKAAQVETLPPPSPVSIEAGSRWEHRRQQDKVVTVVGIKSGKVEFHNGEQVLAYQLTKDYRRVD
ncbi:hypothetical protein D3875_03925 [Deinococcus cavernae]|uniref:DNA replication protein DnaD n=1 Tax=Deinococcus cavernae TaxID=2320857 RepID=A0A418VEA7_9DEIO|nr:hypothetical protein [Deinococcus cavernae]RJF74434.1 hypothetical protein D3875_03925 [Deinococcus cavernae]